MVFPPCQPGLKGFHSQEKRRQFFWGQLQADPAATLATYEPKIKEILQGLVFGGAGMIGAVLEFVVGIIISAVLLANGQKAVQPLYAVMKRLVGESSGPPLVDATGRAVKGVAVGVMGTAFIAALFAWIGFIIAGIPFAVGLAALTFFSRCNTGRARCLFSYR
jgi:predicted PurR-regulated permease PerM